MMMLYHFLALLLVASLVSAEKNCTADELIPCYRPKDTEGNQTGQFICRNRWNLAYLDVVPTPLCVPATWGGEDDTCGCCNGACPVACEEPCPIDGDRNNVGVYVYDWWSWRPRRVCGTKGASLQMKQVNSARWACVPDESFFSNFFSFNDDDEERASFSIFGWSY